MEEKTIKQKVREIIELQFDPEFEMPITIVQDQILALIIRVTDEKRKKIEQLLQIPSTLSRTNTDYLISREDVLEIMRDELLK